MPDRTSRDRVRPLPAPPPPVARYVPSVATGGLVHVSGQGPVSETGAVLVRGVIGAGLTAQEGVRAARLAMRNVLSVLGSRPGGLSRTEAVVRLLVAVACDPSFPDVHRVSGGALDVLGDVPHLAAAAPVCSVIGVPSLPLGIPVEIEAVVRMSKPGDRTT